MKILMQITVFICIASWCVLGIAQERGLPPNPDADGNLDMTRPMTAPPEWERQEFPPRLVLPAGFNATVDGVEAKCFPADDYQTVARIGLTYGKLYDWRLTALGVISGYKLTINSLHDALRFKDLTIKTLKDDRKWLTLRLSQSDENLDASVTGFRYEKYALWAVIIIESGVILVQAIKN